MPTDNAKKMSKPEKRILVVEDDKNINRLIAYNLSQNGFFSESVYDGIEGRDMLRNEPFDIVILDVMLPGIDGFSICKSIKENPAAFKTCVIMVTAKAESHDKLYGNILGADYYLTKPFSVVELMRIVNEVSEMSDKEFVVSQPKIQGEGVRKH